MSDDQHPEDCIICRARNLHLTQQQTELIIEAITAGIAAGWKERGYLDRTPTDHQTRRMMLLAHIAWSELFGTVIPESAEVQAQHHRDH